MKIGTRFVLILIFLAAFVAPAASLDINSSTSLRYFPDSNMEFQVDTSGNIDAKGNLDIGSGNSILNYWDNTCSGGKVVDKIYDNGTLRCVNPNEDIKVENLSETLTAGNVANQSIDMGHNSVENVDYVDLGNYNEAGSGGARVRSYSSGGGAGQLELYTSDDTGNNNNYISLKPNGTEALRVKVNSNVDIPNGNLNMSFNNITQVENIVGYYDSACGTDEAVADVYDNGTFKCTSTVATGQDVENLSLTLQKGNVANQSIDMDDNDIMSVGTLNASLIKAVGQGGKEQGFSAGLVTGSAGNDYAVSYSGQNIRRINSTHFRTATDDSNNGAGMITTTIGNGDLRFYTFPTTGGTEQLIASDNLNSYQRLRIEGSGVLHTEGNNVALGGGTISYAGGSNGLHLASNNDVEITSGNLNVSRSEINGVQDIVASKGSNYLDLNVNSPGQRVGVYDRYNGQLIARFKEGGNVEIPNGDLNVTSGHLNFDTSSSNRFITGSQGQQFELKNTGELAATTDGTGSGKFFVWDKANGQKIAEFNEGGKVIIPNGDLNISDNITSPDDNVTIGDSLKVYGNVWTSGADLAEVYSSEQQLEYGEVVAVNSDKDDSVVRTSSAYQGTVMGVVSDNPSHVMNMGEDGYPIALQGKVNVKVSEENGVIERGDRVVPSSEPGVAMKCEMINAVESNKSVREIMLHNQKCRDSTIARALQPSDGRREILVKLE